MGLVCMYVCPKIYIRRALSKKSQSRRGLKQTNVFNARLNRLVDKSAERREDGRLFQILAPATAKLRSPNVLFVRRWEEACGVKDLRSSLTVLFVVIVAGAGSVDGSTPAAAASAAGGGGAAGGSGELAEDMLQMALRMASEMSEEPVMDLEDSVNPAPVRRGRVLIADGVLVIICQKIWYLLHTSLSYRIPPKFIFYFFNCVEMD